jgi:16S rRNA (uracil1498-N3)-methyltransferase
MTSSGSARARLYTEGDLADGRAIELTAAQAHYLKNVLRLSPGAPIALFNGRDGEWMSHIASLSRNGGLLALDARSRAQTVEPDLWLLFAPIKRARLDFLIQKAVELGVSRLLPVLTGHTDVNRLNADRHRANVIEAAEQCERLSLPDVADACALGDVLAGFPGDRRLLICAEKGEALPLMDVLSAPDRGAGRWAILCGPEGGFSQTELDGFAKLSFITFVSLGPRILRAETAALSAVACWQAALGDWRRRPPDREHA